MEMAEIERKSNDGRTFFKSILKMFHKNDVKYAKNSLKATVFKPKEKVQDDSDEEIDERVINLQEVEILLNEGNYDTNYWLFIKDVALAFNYIRESSNKSSLMYKKAVELSAMFEREMDDWMCKKGYCCGKFYINYAKEIQCSGLKNCLIKDKDKFHRYNDFTFCSEHFSKFTGSTEIQLNDDVKVKRDDFQTFVYLEEKHEEWIACQNCKKLFHERCELFLVNSFVGFLCKKCRHPNDIRFSKFKAKDIRSTDCDNFITNYVKSKFKNDYDDLKLTIRMLSSMEKIFTLKRKFDDYRKAKKQIGYTNNTIFAFYEDSEGYELCFFAVFVQLYGINAPAPNQNTAYISYIDSVKLLQNDKRTKIYQMILLGLFDYLKLQGYEKIFIWSCPPSKNDDYIFPCKPSSQKIPGTQHLSQWYQDLIDKGKKFKIITSSEGSESFAYDNDWSNIDNIPLMDGDMWSVRLAEAIVAVEAEEMKLEKEKTRGGTATYLDKKERIWEIMQVQTKGFDHSYFVLTLNNKGIHKKIANTETINLNWINNRFELVDFFCDLKLQFNTVRQARFATFTILHRIIMESRRCRLCHKHAELDPYLLCAQCNSITSKQPIIQAERM